MKRIFTLLFVCCSFFYAMAATWYVTPNGNDENDGKTWNAAKLTIQSAISAASSGDNVYVAGGTYNEAVSIKDGVNMYGGYDAATGKRDLEVYTTILDGTDLGKFIVVKYDNDCTVPTVFDGFTLQNADHENEGGGAFIRGNMTFNNCIIRNCHGSNGGGFYARSKDESIPAIISNCIIELCSSTSSGGGAYLYQHVEMNNCIVRGCGGKYGAIRCHKPNVTVRNCLLYNNSATVDGWPDSGGIFNEADCNVYNCTVCNNYGAKYAGVHSEGHTYNCVFWGNRNEEGFADPANFISSSSGSHHNVADQGFDGQSFLSLSLAEQNTAAGGPNFRNPTTFVGIPKNAAEIVAMRNADFSLTAASTALIDKADANLAPATDIDGVTRPLGSGVDIGAYEFNANAPVVAVTGLDIIEDTVVILLEETGGVTPLITPRNATNRSVTWKIDDPNIATVSESGLITAVSLGKTKVHATTVDGGFTDFAVVVIEPQPIRIYPHEVEEAAEKYKIEDYTVPSYIPFWVAREAAHLDSLTTDHAVIAEKIAAMNTAIKGLVGKEEPYCMVANINGDPATRMAFCWFTNGGITDGVVQIYESEDANEQYFDDGDGVITIPATATTTKPLAYAVSTSGLLKATGMDRKTKFTYVSHKAIAENLKPGTAYSYRVGYEGHWSDIARFRTKSEVAEEFSFIYMTDSHIMDAEYVSNARQCAEAVAKKEKDARFCVFPGDFVETGTEANSEWEWERWFEESLKPVIMQMPIVPTDGNHDDSNNLNYNYHFNTDNEFNKISKVKPQFDGITYSFVYGDVLFLVYSKQDYWRGSYSYTSLTSTYLTNDLGRWFEQQVAAHPDTKYRIALVHKNVFSGSGHSVDEETPLFRETMLPIMKKCEIDLVLQGHDHCYEVIGPVNPDTRRAITEAISDVDYSDNYIDTNKNMTGKKGGTFVTDDGTMYFIGATCGRKRYYPYDRETMDGNYEKHKVTDYFDLFTSMFGQPGAPSYTKITVSPEALTLESFTSESSKPYNTIKIVRNKEHTCTFAGLEEYYQGSIVREGEKFMKDGHIYIRYDGHTYNMLGVCVE